MIASGRVAHLARRGADYGVWNIPAANIENSHPHHKAYHSKEDGQWENLNVVLDMQKVRQRKRDIVNQFRGGSERRANAQEGLEVIMGDASFKDKDSLTVKTNGGEEVEVQAENVFLNTGERPLRPNLPGLDSLDQSRVLDSTTVMELGEVPHHLIVLGGGYIGLEFGQLFRRLGSRVTVIQRSKQLVPREDPEIADAVKEILEQDGMKILLSTEVANIKPDDCGQHEHKIIVFHTDDKGHNVAISGSHLLLATGRTPNSDTLNLEAAGVEVDKRGHIKVNEQLQTNVPGIYAIGDVHGGPAFTHVSYDDMRILKANFLESRSPAASTKDRDLITPYVMYIDPQLAHVGLHEYEARSRYPDAKIQTASMPMAHVARALETDETRGLMKAVINADDGLILGFTCLGLEGGRDHE